MDKPWWFPEKVDAAHCAQLREDYPDKAEGMDDEELIEYFDNGQKYSTTWDHIGDAYEQYEPLVDAFLGLLAASEAALALLTGTGQDGTLGHHPDNPVPAALKKAIDACYEEPRVSKR